MLELNAHPDPIRSLAYAADSRLLASGGEDRLAYLWDLSQEEPIAEYAHPAEVERVSFNPATGFLACGTASGELFLWDQVLPSTPRSRVEAHPVAVRGLAHSSSGQVLASLSWQGAIKLWVADPLQERGELVPADFLATALTFLIPDQVLAVACLDGKIRVVDGWNREILHVLPNDHSLVSIASHGDRWLAAGSSSGAVLLWDLPDRLLRPALEGHTGPVYGLAFTPDGKSLISGGADGSVRVWDMDTGQQKQCYRWHKSWVTCVAVAPNGMTAASGSEDTTIVVWDLDQE